MSVNKFILCITGYDYTGVFMRDYCMIVVSDNYFVIYVQLISVSLCCNV